MNFSTPLVQGYLNTTVQIIMYESDFFKLFLIYQPSRNGSKNLSIRMMSQLHFKYIKCVKFSNLQGNVRIKTIYGLK